MGYKISALVAGKRFGSTTEKLVAMILAEACDNETWSTVMSQGHIAEVAQVSSRTVRRVFDAWEERGLIRREQTRRQDGYRGADRIVFVCGQLEMLPDTMSAKNDSHRTLTTISPDTDDNLSGHLVSAHIQSLPSKNQSSDDADFSLPVDNLVKRWAELRGVPLTRPVRKAWWGQMFEYVQTAGIPSDELLQEAVRRGIESPAGLGFISTHDVLDSDGWERILKGESHG